ncbi:MAG: hypothetical protein ACR2JV_07055 [Gaiellales bacterium]
MAVLSAAAAFAVVAVAVYVVATGTAAADPPSLSVVGSGPGEVTVDGTGGDGGGVWLYQCADSPENEQMFYEVCDTGSGLQVTDDAPWSVQFPTQAVIRLRDGFAPRTENAIGNGTFDCQAADAHCMIAATSDWQSFSWARIPFDVIYGTLGKATVSGPTTDLIDGALVQVRSAGHRPRTQAMAYICPSYGYAFPGGCDPVPSSEATIPFDGVYQHVVSMPRFLWVNDPFGQTSWFDCAAGCSVLVASADNLTSASWKSGADALLRFRDVPLEQHPQLLTVDRARVNRSGGITIDGRVDCTQAVLMWGQGGSAASVHVAWTARQPVGRKSAVIGRYDAVVASMCHDPAGGDPLTPPYPWITSPPITQAVTWWVFPSPGGKFAAGPIHVDVQVTGGSWSASPGADRYILTGTVQWDGKAVKG